MAYDSARQKVVLFGGISFLGLLADTWTWDGKTWTKMTPASSPSERRSHAMAYDAGRQKVVLFGGSAHMWGSVAGTWTWDGSNWTQMKPASSHSRRSAHAMAYDSARHRMVLFGGGAASVLLADTWTWDGKTWTRMTPASSPRTRHVHAMAYDSVRQRTMLFGGLRWTASGWVWLGDTWEYGIAKLTLTANTPTISIANGGTQTLTLNAGADLKNKLYWIFGSMTGTMPGVVLTGIHIPLVPDIYTNIAIGAVNTPVFTNFRGTLGATGTATASLNVPAILSIPTGFKLYHAYVVYDNTTGQIFTSSNPVSVEFK